MGFTCEYIIFDSPKKAFKAGDQVKGIVKYTILDTEEYEEISISLIGTGKCAWSENSKVSYEGEEKYVDICQHLLKKEEEQKTALVAKGEYTKPFDFVLPKDIPSSFTDKICTITYEIIVKFVRPNNRSETFNKIITVYGIASSELDVRTFDLQKNIIKPCTYQNKYVNLSALLNKTQVISGETLSLALTIENCSDVTITAVKTKLMRYTTYVSDEGYQKKHIKKIKGTKDQTESIKSNRVTKVSLDIPTMENLYSVQNSKILIREYMVRMTAKFPWPHKDVSIEIPVVIFNQEDRKEDLEDILL